MSRPAATPTVTIDVPAVPHAAGRPLAADLRTAARKLWHGYAPGGSNVRDTVATILDRVAHALDGADLTTDRDPLTVAPDGRPVADLTFAERTELPAVYHQPVWLALGDRSARWACRVCQADGGTVMSWPCPPARRDGGPIAEYAGLDFSD